MVDQGVYVLASNLLDRLLVEIAETRAGAACFGVVHPGNMTPAYGWCACDPGEGMAWVRVVNMYPTASFPAPFNTVRNPSSQIQTAVVLEMGVDRCYWNTEDNGMPPPAALDSLARDAIDDSAAMLRAVWCFTPKDADRIPGPWMPRGPLGGIHGGTMTVTVLADVWCGPGACSAPPTVKLDEMVPPLPGDPRHPE